MKEFSKIYLLSLVFNCVLLLGTRQSFGQGKYFTGIDDGYSSEFMSLPLPIVLGSFSLNEEKKNVRVKWSTYSEVNNNYFKIEKSTDGILWKSVNKVAGAGNSNDLLQYSILDSTPYLGVSYYRIIQVDFDGTETISAYSSINIIGNFSFVIFPNPVENFLNLQISVLSESKFDISILSSSGKVEFLKSTWVEGNQIVDLDVSYLSSGTYQISISGLQGELVQRFIKL